MRIKGLAIMFALTGIARLLLSPGFAHGSTTTNLLQTSAVIPAGSGSCSFDTGGPYAIVFPSALDPVSPPPVTTASVTFNVTCTGLTGGGKTVIIDRLDGSQLYLRNGSNQIPYSLNLPYSQAAKNNKSAPVTLTATIIGTAYQNVPAGSYSDTIIINVIP